MVTAKQLKMLQWVLDEADGLLGMYTGYPEEVEYRLNLERARSALAAVRSDYRAARLARRQAVSAPRRALQRVGAK